MGQPMNSCVFWKVLLKVMFHFLGGKENSPVHARTPCTPYHNGQAHSWW